MLPYLLKSDGEPLKSYGTALEGDEEALNNIRNTLTGDGEALKVMNRR